MFKLFVISFLPVIVSCSSEGNIHLLHDEIAAAIRSCSISNSTNRQRRSDNFDYNYNGEQSPNIDGNMRRQTSQDNYEIRNKNGTSNQRHVLNATDYDYGGYGNEMKGEKFIKEIPHPVGGSFNYNSSNNTGNRTKRNVALLNKAESNECLSQCVFANLQVVDSKGIPREAEFWNKLQTEMSSQQSRTVLKDQIRACFQELQLEAEDNGCSYSNKLERCLMLRFSDRKLNITQKS